MKQNIYAIYDSKMNVFSTPFFSPNNATALRSFSDAANDGTTNICKHPEDFSLHHLGTFEDDLGVIEGCQTTNLGLAADYHEQIT
jgi:hypothetical protein